MPQDQQPRLDDLYKMTAYIYADKLSSRSSSATFAHLVEVCGMLTIHDRKKKREGLDVTDALCKSLGWYFPLLAKFKVKSVEELIYRKFPGVCPYCREAPHQEMKCKQVKGTAPTLNHAELAEIYRRNWSSRPSTLNAWQQMFDRIYPRQLTDQGRSTVGLLEELGELAEAVRVGDAHPKYFLGEAADTFSYIMGIANEHKLRLAESGREFFFEDEFLRQYPGLCMQCGCKVCVCPSVPQATIGRMAKEIEIGLDEEPFIKDQEDFSREGQRVAHEVLELLGGFNGLTGQLPLDRGDANHALILLCERIAEAVSEKNPDLASNLRAEAFRMGVSVRSAGTPRLPLDMEPLLRDIANGWSALSTSDKEKIKADQNLIGDFGNILEGSRVVRVLFVHCSPADAEHLRVTSELRIIRQSVRHGAVKIDVDDLPAATIDDLRTKLLHADYRYDVIHFAGHSDGDMLIFETVDGATEEVPLDAIANLLGKQNTGCVILNACSSIQNLRKSIAMYTIGMKGEIEDNLALEFSRGFYDALSAGKNVEEAYDEGITAVTLKGGSSSDIRLLKRKVD